MKGLTSDVRKALNEYKSTIHIKNRDVLAASRADVERASTDDITVKPEIANISNALNKYREAEEVLPIGFVLRVAAVCDLWFDGVTSKSGSPEIPTLM